MGVVVNLRRAREARAKSDTEAQAAANRAAFGRTKAEKQLSATEAASRDRKLDGSKLDH